MLLQRVTEAAQVNEFASHPDILPAIGGVPIDFTGAMNPANVFLIGAFGAFCYEWKGPETYEVHVMISNAGRGPWCFAAAREAMAFMADHGATRVWARIHPDRREVAILAARSGFREWGSHTLDIGNGPVVWRIFDWGK